MQTRLSTSALNTLGLDEGVAWAGTAGFEALEVDVARHVGDPSAKFATGDTGHRDGIEVGKPRE